MTDLLDKLAQAEREEEALDARIDALAEAALAGGTAAADPEQDPLLAAERLRAAYAPLSTQTKEAIALRIAREVSAGQTSAADPPAKAKPAAPSGRMHPLGRVLGWSLPLAAAAAVLIGVWGAESPPAFRLEPYRLEVTSGVARAERGAAQTDSPRSAARAEPVRIEPGAELGVVVRPERPVTAGVAAHAYVRPSSGELLPLAARVEAAPSGALRLFLSAQPAWPDRGDIVIWIGAASVAPKPDELASGAPASGAGWQRLEQPFERAQAR